MIRIISNTHNKEIHFHLFNNKAISQTYPISFGFLHLLIVEKATKRINKASLHKHFNSAIYSSTRHKSHPNLITLENNSSSSNSCNNNNNNNSNYRNRSNNKCRYKRSNNNSSNLYYSSSNSKLCYSRTKTRKLLGSLKEEDA